MYASIHSPKCATPVHADINMHMHARVNTHTQSLYIHTAQAKPSGQCSCTHHTRLNLPAIYFTRTHIHCTRYSIHAKHAGAYGTHMHAHFGFTLRKASIPANAPACARTHKHTYTPSTQAKPSGIHYIHTNTQYTLNKQSTHVYIAHIHTQGIHAFTAHTHKHTHRYIMTIH
jgi:hypothetical protein